jgi:hypothetical protein
MEKKHYSIEINAPQQKVWETLWDESTYRKWTSVFSEGSTVKTDWKKGSKVLFVDGTNSGMVSMIADNKPGEYMSFKHLGMVKDGVEDMENEETKRWSGAMENYTLSTINGKTQVQVDIDITDDFVDYFEKTWPEALKKLKTIAENN